MASTKLMQEIEDVLQQFEGKYFVGDKVNKARVIEDIDNYDAELMAAMLDIERIKKNFTTKIAEHTVFKTNEFIEVFQADEYWEDSYTKYSKKIGLTSNGNFLDEASETVLDFPYKDTVLKASMSKEDTDKEDLKPDEPFLNEVIAREEIDVLLDKKILKNAKRYTADGEEETSDFSNEDNLILKGNNLLALHTLKDEYAGKVKFIYLDPPYNTGNDSFNYNDRFNHSTWLTFMKNRLEVAKELLKDDGIIAIQTDYHESAYIRILLDEIFGRNAQISDVTVKMSTPSGPKMAHIDIGIPKLKDSIAIYTNGKVNINKQPYKMKETWDKEYSKILINFEYEDYLKLNDSLDKENIEDINEILENVELSTISKEYPKYKEDIKWLQKNAWRIVADKQNTGLDNLLAQNKQEYRQDIAGIKSKRGNIQLFRTDKEFGKDTRVEIIFAVNNLKEHVGDLWTDISTSGGFSAEGGVNFPNAKKPEKLLKRLIEMFTVENDLVLDFFMGSATTQAVAHKLNRKYVGIEQMNYIEAIAVSRLQNVIKGEQTGISEDVDWQGGGSFVYAELMEKNRGYLTDVMDASDQESLRQTFNLMLESADFDFRVDLKEVQDSLNTLSLEDQKRVLVKILDKNQLYYNYSEIDDENVRDLISDNDYEFNKNFYKEDNDE